MVGKYDWVDGDITEKHFPINIPADYDAEYKLFHFNRVISSDDAIKEMKKEGYRPATLVELLVLGETQPELQRLFQIIALSPITPWDVSHGDYRVPTLTKGNAGRELTLNWSGDGWNAYSRFLGILK